METHTFFINSDRDFNSENNNVSELLKKSMYSCLKKKHFDSLSLRPLGLRMNLLGLFVAYSQPFNLTY
jgi:hypothetical protein